MTKIRLMLAAVSVATAVVGCAHCDTCDDFPAPDTAGMVNYGGYGNTAPVGLPGAGAPATEQPPAAGQPAQPAQPAENPPTASPFAPTTPSTSPPAATPPADNPPTTQPATPPVAPGTESTNPGV
jgi:hypothetical protein